MDRTVFKPLLLAASLLACMPTAQAASTLVYCSEASPAGFDPSQYTSGTDFDASAETVFNRLTQFKRGGTEVEPGLATRWEVSKDGLAYIGQPDDRPRAYFALGYGGNGITYRRFCGKRTD